MFSGCDGKADIIFVVDSSGSIREARFQTVLEYVANITRQLEVSENRARVGLVTYGDYAQVEFNLNTFYRSV